MPTFNEAPSNVNFAREEEKTLEFWKKIDAFQTSYNKSLGKPLYTFYDGPPFATGLPHYGHILAGTIKDCVTRYAHQTGHCVERRFGWDCHGLPVEFEIDKVLNIKGREDVMRIGIDKYNEECRSIVMRYANEWRSTVERMGRWVDFDNDYKTLDKNFMESVWWVFSELYKKGLVYRAFKVMPYSMACNTPLSNFELQQNYKEDIPDPSVVVSFPMVENPSVRFLAWTTTPWTLPTNLALCVRADFDYVKVRVEGPVEFPNAPANSETLYVIAKSRMAWLLEELKNGFHGKKEEKAQIKLTVVEELKGSDLVGKKYTPLFDYFNKAGSYWNENSFRIVADEYVSDASGTGIVHQAPAFGEDDYRVCIANKIIQLNAAGEGLPCPLDQNGCYTDEVPEHKGVNVKDADNDIKIRLKNMGRILVNSVIRHSYPFCWRSDTPLIYRAIPAWFIKVEDIRERLVENNKQTRWVPDNVREGRFHNWLEGATDWCVSRNRYWGTPLPLWVSEDYSEIKCIGSVAELEALTGKKYDDIHRHFIDNDEIISPETGKVLKRVDEVFDCWFESGSMPYGQLHYPFENQDKFENGFPADFIAEGLDQTRGWFYTLMVIGTALFDKPPFKNLIVNGLVLAADGKKMSKRLKNYPDPNELINQYGADAIRLYLINSPVVHAETLKFKEEGVRDVIRDCFLPLFNSYKFMLQEVSRYENLTGSNFVPSPKLSHASSNPTDKWILASVHSLVAFIHTEMNAYRLYTIVPAILSFLDNLTNWYIRFNRDRMRGADGVEEAMCSLSTLFEVVMTVTQIMSPFTPFLSEHLYQNLSRALPENEREESIHYCNVPVVNESLRDAKAEALFNNMKAVIEVGRALREKRKVGLKTPLARMTVIHPDQSFLEDVKTMESYILEQLNVLEISYTSDPDAIVYSALPNTVRLGKKLGKKFGDVGKAVRALESSVLRDFLVAAKANPEATLVICDEPLVVDDLVLKSEPKKSADPNIDSHSDQNCVVSLDFTPDVALIQMAIVRETANLVQKARKEAGLMPEDDIHVVVLPEADEATEALAAQQEYGAKLIRRPLSSAAVSEKLSAPLADGSFGPLCFEKEVELLEKMALLRIYKK